jgi:hypothetical protein
MDSRRVPISEKLIFLLVIEPAMNPINKLSVLAYKIANDFVSSANSQFLFFVTSLVKDPTGVFEIDLLRQRITPLQLIGGSTDAVIKKYRTMLLAEMAAAELTMEEIQKASIKSTFKPSKAGRVYDVVVTIKAGEKEYVKTASTASA